MGQPATKIMAPVATVELLSYIGDPILAYTQDSFEFMIPHSFLKVTDVNGNKSYVGFAPETTGLVGVGEIFNNGDHLITNSSGPITLSADQGTRLKDYINGSIDTPPYYNLPEGSQCAVWALNGILNAMTGEVVQSPIAADSSVPDPLGALITVLMNPYTAAILNGKIQTDQFYKEVGFAAVTAAADGIDGLNNLGSKIGQTLPTPYDISTYTAQQIEAGQHLLEGVSDAAKSAYDAALTSTTPVTNAIADSLQQTLATTTSYAQSLLDTYDTAVGQTPESAAAFYDGMTNWAADRVEDIAKLYGQSEQAAKSLADKMQTGYERIKDEAGSDLGLVKDYLGKALDSLADVAKGIGNAVLDFLIPSAYGDELPSWTIPFDKTPLVVCPLILDLDNNGVQVAGLDHGVYFDHNGDGFAEKSAWTEAGDGLLVWDKNGDGKITTGNELFGDQTRMKNGRWGQNGFDVLAEYDDNGDHKIDANDAVWSNLKLWVDANQDGISSANEIHSLADYGVASISTAYQQINRPEGGLQSGSYTKTDGTTSHAVDDSTFQVSSAQTIARNQLSEPADIAVLPNLKGYGTVRDLHQAMVRDTSGALKTLVQQFAAEPTRSGRETLLEKILLTWTDSNIIAPNSRDNTFYGVHYDARKLNVIEQFNGKGLIQPLADSGHVETNPIPQAVPLLNESYSGLFEMMYDGLMAQTHLKAILGEISFVWDASLGHFKMDTTQLVATIANTYAADHAAGTTLASEFARYAQLGVARLYASDTVTVLDQLGQLGSDMAGEIKLVTEKLPGLTINGTTGDDLLDGSTGRDFISGNNGNDILHGGFSADYIDGGNGNDVLLGDAGDDALFGGYGDDTLDGGTGNDDLDGGMGNDTYLFGRGSEQDTINDYDTTVGNSDTIRLATNVTPADVTLWRDATNLYLGINGTEDKITVPNWYLDPACRVEQIAFADGTVWDTAKLQTAIFLGTNGVDYLTGTDQAEIFDGLGGADNLDGGGGNDVYLFRRGSGQDTINDYDITIGNSDTIRLAADVAPADVTLWRDASNLYLGINDTNDTNDTITVQGWYDDPVNRVEQIAFADGTGWDTAKLQDAVFLGTDGMDYLTGTDQAEIFDGLSGADNLDGGGGNDVYLFRRGSGQDTINDYDATPGNSDTIRLAADVAPADVTLWRDASNLYLGINDTNDTITVQSWYEDTAYRVEQIAFADGTVWDTEKLQAAVFLGTDGMDYLTGTDQAEIFDGLSGADNLDGGGGNDVYLFGRGSGQDTISDYDPTAGNSDTIRLAAGIAPAGVTLWRDTSNLYVGINGTSDTITVQSWYDAPAYRVEQIAFTDGTAWDTTKLQAAVFLGTNGVDYLTGTDQEEIFDGLGGADNLDGSIGNDTYLFGRGSGQDTINDYDTTAGNSDTIRLAADVAPADVRLWRDASNLYLGINGTGDTITVQSWYDDPAYRVEQIEFADGTLWNTATLAAAKFAGTDAADTLYGTAGADVMEGLGGDDDIAGDAGNDTLDGGTGNDTLDGGTGNDTYLFGRGGSQDTINDYDTTAGNSDTIRLTADVAPADVSLWRDASNLYLSINGTSDRIAVQSWFDATAYRVERIAFADGTVWGTSVMQAAGFRGGDGADSLTGTTANDLLEGWGGNDYLSGDTGNDTLDGGTGNDSLDGGAGNDVYLFARGYGQDSVSETSGSTDVVRFKADMVPGDVEVYRDADNLYFGIRGTGDRLSIDNWYLGSAYRIERAEFADGTLWDSAALAAKINQATEYADHYWGSTGNDTFSALGGDDQLAGNEGSDILNGGAGNDLLDGGTGTDTLAGGAGDDTYVVDNVADVVTENANEGADTVQSSIAYILAANFENLALTGAAAINGSGNALDNLITGNAADNVLDGGAGNDTLIGGLGNDTYVLDNPSDTASELAGEGTDTIQAGFTYTLGANLEKLTLTGTAAVDGYGNELANTLTGNAAVNHLWGGAGNDSISGGASNDILDGGSGNDALNGGAGADLMTGGLGNDTYTVDNAGDIVTELENEGTDKVNSAIGYALGATLENLTLTGSGNLNGTGTERDNVLVGNAGANVLTGGLGNDTLDGGAGADTLLGGSGDDIYVVDNAADVATENASEGSDTVQSSITWTLAANIEKLTLTGSTAINGTGNALDNVLTGNAYDNVLDGGTGNDSLIGGAGNDTYVLDNPADIVTENLNEGTDMVRCGFDYTLSTNLENLTLTGTVAANGFGNEFANALTGNGTANYLWGGTGADTLNGGGGNDFLQGGADNDILTDNSGKNLFDGGAGVDTFTGGAGNELFIGGAGNDTITTGTGADIIAFNRGNGKDTVKASTGADNVLSLGGGIGYADLLFSKASNNLVLTTGANESITFQNWYAAATNHSVVTLQVIAAAMAGYDASSSDSLLSHKVQEFDFTALVNAFDAARTANSTLTSWNLTNGLAGAQLASSDTAALGGELAYRYGMNDSLTDVGLAAVQGVLTDPQFGNQVQAIQP